MNMSAVNNFEFSINEKSIYQCKYGHSACDECWEKSLKTKNECMICRTKVKSFKNLSRCLVIEQDFGKKECCCIYSFTEEILDDRSVGKKFKRELIKDEENGCKEILNVKDLDNHIQNCEFKFIKCPNKVCDKVFRSNSFGEHGNECTFKLVTCEYCKKDDIKKGQVENHLNEVCPKVIVYCLQGCQMKMERDEMKNHIENHCNNTIVNCKYHEQGCDFTMKRSELLYHLENVNHQFYMTELIDKLISKLDQSNKINIDLNKKLQLEFNPLVYKSKWTISKYSLFGMTIGEPQKIISPKFNFFSHEFQVGLYPHGEKNKNRPSIFLFINNINGNSVKAEISFTFVNVLDKSRSITEHLGEKVYKKSCGVGNNVFIPSNLINKENGWKQHGISLEPLEASKGSQQFL
ncbi:hypothetical protein ACTFIW_008978 [Dictyostelium discoideum]